ncbi:NADPH-dependent FMN reductase [Maritalea myrionectae]|uniref:NADPH-dependent FMN reductase n=1 Tax=Maritalea myrionectae TaxID=454601 RepID=UPI000488D206|nr:NADPH-dependent FMN reductase [Maritalea myrionectae]
MKFLALSGSGRSISTNTALLRSVADIASPVHQVKLFAEVADLPVFSPDLEAAQLPESVQAFADLIRESDGLIISSPEYVRGIPGGLKNAIDWLVSREEIISKPIALMHASHRGDDMLAQLRLVLSTVSHRFAPDLFLRFEFMALSPDDIAQRMARPENQDAVRAFLEEFTDYCKQ